MATLIYKTGNWKTDHSRPEEDIQYVVIRPSVDCLIEQNQNSLSHSPSNQDEFVLTRSFTDHSMNINLTHILSLISKILSPISSSGQDWLEHTH